MAEKGLFFNAFPNDEYETGYDRNYSADDISNWLKTVLTNGVIKTDNVAGTGEPQGLKVLADSGLNIKVNAGLAVIEGKPYINNSTLPLTLATAPTSGTRYDCVVLRMDNTQVIDARKTYVFIQSLDHVPTEADLTRDQNIYDLLLAYVSVGANVTTIQQTNITDTRGDKDLCPWCTAIKGYEDYYDAIVQRFESDITLQSAGSVVVTNLAVSLYNNKYSLISVYCNGLREDESDYSVDTSNEYITINFEATKNAGSEISVILENLIDGEGLSNVLNDYNRWVVEVANLQKLNEYNYYCNGINDNVLISNIVNDYLSSEGGAYYQTLRLNIIGNFGMTAPAGGDGTSANPYGIFAFDTNAGAKKIELDFTSAKNSGLTITDGKETIIFKGNNLRVIGATIVANNQSVNTKISVFGDEQRIRADNCRFFVYGYVGTRIAYAGTFINCRGYVRNISGNSACFEGGAGKFVNIVGGEFTAHAQGGSAIATIVYCSVSTAVFTMYAVVAPSLTVTNYRQTNSIYQTAGKLSSFGLVSDLAVSKTTGATEIGTISARVYNQVW